MDKQFLLLDQGNSRLKYRLLNSDGKIQQEGLLTNEQIDRSLAELSEIRAQRIWICRSAPLFFEPADVWPGISVSFFSPEDAKGLIRWSYPDIGQLGPDRAAALLGARNLFPDQHLVVADAGTCLTVDFLRADGVHLGGYISPGYQMRLKAMHTFTRSLPSIEQELPEAILPGTNTLDCMRAGALAGLISEIERHFATSLFGKNQQFSCILTGGDAKDLAHHLKESTFVARDLVLQGLESICRNS